MAVRGPPGGVGEEGRESEEPEAAAFAFTLAASLAESAPEAIGDDYEKTRIRVSGKLLVESHI